MKNINCDLKRNRNNIKGQIITFAFRIAHLGTKNKIIFSLLIPYLIIYKVSIEWILGVEIPWKTKIGAGLIVYHGQSLVINDGTIIGDNCTVRHCVTIGNKRERDGTYSRCPIIENNVDIGANVCILGNIRIGSNTVIGAGAVVVKSIPPNSIAIGNPAKVIKENEDYV